MTFKLYATLVAYIFFRNWIFFNFLMQKFLNEKNSVILNRRVLKGQLGHTSESPFHAQRYLFNQIHFSDWFIALHDNCFRSIDWLIDWLVAWFTALHNNCFRSIDWLVAWFFSRAWLLYSYQIIVFFLTAFIMSSRNIFTPNKVAKSDQKWPKVARILRRFKESRLLTGKKSPRNALRTLLSLAGPRISTIHTIFNTIFYFFPDFSVWKRIGMVIFGQLIDKLREKNSEPLWTVSDRVGHIVLVGLEIDPWRRDGTALLYDGSCSQPNSS